jgi:hypothetical protein
MGLRKFVMSATFRLLEAPDREQLRQCRRQVE